MLSFNQGKIYISSTFIILYARLFIIHCSNYKNKTIYSDQLIVVVF